MAICATTLLAICIISGLIVGKLIGMQIGVDADVGGLGIAMLILVSERLRSAGWITKRTFDVLAGSVPRTTGAAINFHPTCLC